MNLINGLHPLVPLLVSAAATALVLVVAFVVVRGVFEGARRRLLTRIYGKDAMSAESILLPGAMSEQDAGAAGRMDQKFNELVKQTGQGWTPAQVLGLMCLLSVGLAGGLFLWREDLSLVALGLILGQSVPMLACLALQRRQKRLLQTQLPDALFLLSRSLRAGLSLEQAMSTVAQHGTKPLAEEFKRGSDQVRLGLPVTAALHGMADRLRLADFNIFVTAVSLYRTMGGNLTQLLDRVATAIRDRNLFRGYFQAATALGRLTAFIVAAAAPLLFVGYALWQPELMGDFARNPSGARALGVALGLEVIGCTWLFYLLRVEY